MEEKRDVLEADFGGEQPRIVPVRVSPNRKARHDALRRVRRTPLPGQGKTTWRVSGRIVPREVQAALSDAVGSVLGATMTDLQKVVGRFAGFAGPVGRSIIEAWIRRERKADRLSFAVFCRTEKHAERVYRRRFQAEDKR